MHSRLFVIDRDYVREVGRRSEAETARSLEVLNAIDVTCGALHAQADAMARESAAAHETVHKINAGPLSCQFDPDGAIVATFRNGQARIEQIVSAMESRRQHAERDGRLRDDDGVIEAFDRAIEAAREYHNAIGELIFAVMESDADISASSPVFESADELIDSLKR